MDEINKGRIWTTEALVTLGMWLLQKGETGYGLLCIHSPILGIKIGQLLNLRWKDFINPITNESHEELSFRGYRLSGTESSYLELNPFIQRITASQILDTSDKARRFDYEDFIYTKQSNGKVITTSTFNREIQRFYEEFCSEIKFKTNLNMEFRILKSNAFEIAWARDMVEYYARSKKVFVAVSKYMGHRMLKDTIDLLEIEPRDEITFRFDMYNPVADADLNLTSLFNNSEKLKKFLLKRSLATTI